MYQVINWVLVVFLGVIFIGFILWGFDYWRDFIDDMRSQTKRDKKTKINNLLSFCILMEDKGGILHKSPKYVIDKYNEYIANDSLKQKIDINTFQRAKKGFLALNSPEWINTVCSDKELIKKIKKAIKPPKTI